MAIYGLICLVHAYLPRLRAQGPRLHEWEEEAAIGGECRRKFHFPLVGWWIVHCHMHSEDLSGRETVALGSPRQEPVGSDGLRYTCYCYLK